MCGPRLLLPREVFNCERTTVPDQRRFGVGKPGGIYIQHPDSFPLVKSESLPVMKLIVANGDQQRMFTLYGCETL
jgi:hypothetical protein